MSYKINVLPSEGKKGYAAGYSPLPSIQMIDNNLDELTEERLVFKIGE